jgi:hypothetical protein
VADRVHWLSADAVDLMWCSVVQYDDESLLGEFGERFRIVDSFEELHHTPFGTEQQFLYCSLELR